MVAIARGYQANEPVDKLAVNSVHWCVATGTLALRSVIHGSKDLTKRTSDSAIQYDRSGLTGSDTRGDRAFDHLL